MGWFAINRIITLLYFIKMKKGDIVRRTMKVGGKLKIEVVEYGPCMRVMSVNRNSNFVTVEYLSGSKKPTIALKDTLVIIRTSCIQINHETFAAIRQGRRTLSHAASAQWLKIYKSLPVLLQIRDFDFSNDVMLFKINDMKKRKDLWREGDEIYVELGERLL